jgi:hypothetical protein
LKTEEFFQGFTVYFERDSNARLEAGGNWETQQAASALAARLVGLDAHLQAAVKTL